jgi:hydroxymethylpyrimidine pyrophosphatase-like HAD family hydrolase
MIMKQLIALDIDGTLTSELHRLPSEVRDYLKHLEGEGCQIVLITGRSYSLAYPPLSEWDFPYLLAVHNGALILEMPHKRIISTQYIDKGMTSVLDCIVEEEETDYGLYTGLENDDLCYYRPHLFSSRLREYVQRRAELCREDWRQVESFDLLPLNSITAIKFFGDRPSAERIQKRVEAELSLHIPVIRDPIDETVFIAQATHPGVDKGSVIDKVRGREKLHVIAAGDDHNDIPMLVKADVKIVMSTAPLHVQTLADVIAKPAKDNGIIEALEYARHNRI